MSQCLIFLHSMARHLLFPKSHQGLPGSFES